MFAVHCTTWDSTVLLSESSIMAMSNTPAGAELTLECHCGGTHTLAITGAVIAAA